MQTRFGLAVFILFLFLSAGGGQEKPDLKLTVNGLGDLDSDTAFSIEAVSKALPGYVITAEKYHNENGPHPMIAIRDGEEVIAYVYPGFENVERVGAIAVVTDRVAFNNRVTLGTSFAVVAPNYETCSAGFEAELGTVYCRDSNAPNIVFQFVGKALWEYATSVPPVDVLRQSTVAEISWQPNNP